MVFLKWAVVGGGGLRHNKGGLGHGNRTGKIVYTAHIHMNT